MGLSGSKFSTFDKTLPDVSGKVFVITGTTSGTGFVAAQTVAEHHGEVLLLNRPSSRSIASLEKLRTLVPEGKFVPIDCDLQSFDSVRTACREIIETKHYTKIYCLSNNAGIMATPDEITGDGYDKQMQTNHLSHFLLTRELFPLLLQSAKEDGDARIVQHSSLARDMTPHKALEERYFTHKDKDGELGGDESIGFLNGPEWFRYHQTKLANSVFCQSLHDKLVASQNEDCRNVLSLCAHPGASKTNLADHLKNDTKNGVVVKVVLGLLRALVSQTAEDGTMGLLKGMMDVRENVAGGTLYGPVGMAGMVGNAVAIPAKPHETDPAAKDMLWKTSEAAIGASFDI